MASREPQPQDDRLERYLDRDYAAFCLENRIYAEPVDEQEGDRLVTLNNILRELFDGRLVFPPFPSEVGEAGPDVLDCGSGKGSWVEDLLERYEDVEINATEIDVYLGTGDDDDEGDDDVDVVQDRYRKRWNLNARFSEDTSEDRLRPESFDLINSRCLSGGIKGSRWPSYIRELRDLLRPGGWLQMCELDLVFQSSAGRQLDDSPLVRWRQCYSDAMQAMGMNPRVCRALGTLMGQAGFRNVSQRTFQLPIGSHDPTRAPLGASCLENMSQMLESISMWPALEVSRMDETQYRELIDSSRRELHQSEHRWYINV